MIYFNLYIVSMLQLCCKYAAKKFSGPNHFFPHFCGTNLRLFTNLCAFSSNYRTQAHTTPTKLKSGRNDHVDTCTAHHSRARKFLQKLVI